MDEAGPIVTAAVSLKPDFAVLLATRAGITPTEHKGGETLSRLEDLGIPGRLFLLDFPDPTDMNDIFPGMLEKVLDAREKIRETFTGTAIDNVVVATSGTPQMQVVMMLLADSILNPATLYQAARPGTTSKSGTVRAPHERVTKFDLLVLKRIELKDRLIIALQSGDFSAAVSEIKGYLHRYFGNVSSVVALDSPFSIDRCLPELKRVFLAYAHWDNLSYDDAAHELSSVDTSMFSADFRDLIVEQVATARALFASETSGYELLDIHANAVRRFHEEILRQRAANLKILPRKPEDRTVHRLRKVVSEAGDPVLREIDSTNLHGHHLRFHLDQLNYWRNGCIHETQAGRRRRAKTSVEVTALLVSKYYELTGAACRPADYCFHPDKFRPVIVKELQDLYATSKTRTARA